MNAGETLASNLCSRQTLETSLSHLSCKVFTKQYSSTAATRLNSSYAIWCFFYSVACVLMLCGCVYAEEDPFSDELDVEQELARLVRSADKSEELQDLDR